MNHPRPDGNAPTRLPSNPTGRRTHPGGTGCAHPDSTSCTSTTVNPTCRHERQTIGRTWNPARHNSNGHSGHATPPHAGTAQCRRSARMYTIHPSHHHSVPASNSHCSHAHPMRQPRLAAHNGISVCDHTPCSQSAIDSKSTCRSASNMRISACICPSSIHRAGFGSCGVCTQNRSRSYSF